MKKIVLFSLLVSMLFAYRQKEAGSANGSGNKELARLFDGFLEKKSRLFPLDGTQQGDNRYNDLLPNDQTQAFRDSLRTLYQTYLDEIKKFDYTQLDDNDK